MLKRSVSKMMTRLAHKGKSGKRAVQKAINARQLNGTLNKTMHSAGRVNRSRAGMDKYDMTGGPTGSTTGKYRDFHRKSKPLMHRRSLQAGSAIVGAAGMSAIAMMNGAMSAASNNMTARYMQDSRYSSKLLQHRVGNAAGSYE